ncbi:MAG: hypothetical protein JWN12_841 [Candidatus Saccharibacteria bacterium]|nr:hypothetical protein [Candidatus Saccharibacteria bacterium]
MNAQYENVSEYTEGYVRVSPDLLTTPTIIYEKSGDAPTPPKHVGKASAYITTSTVAIGERLDIFV